MKAYLAYQEQIQGFTDVYETVKSVEKLAASHVQSARKTLQDSQRSLDLLTESIRRWSYVDTVQSSALCRSTKQNSGTIIIVCGGARGLVGGLYTQLASMPLVKKDRIILIGHEMARVWRDERTEIPMAIYDTQSPLSTLDFETILRDCMHEFLRGACSRVNAVCIGDQIFDKQHALITHQLLPVPLPETIHTDKAGGLPIVEPSHKRIRDVLMEHYVRSLFHITLQQAQLSEYISRALAMERASNRANDYIHDLVHAYQKERRYAITQQELETFRATKSSL